MVDAYQSNVEISFKVPHNIIQQVQEWRKGEQITKQGRAHVEEMPTVVNDMQGDHYMTHGGYGVENVMIIQFRRRYRKSIALRVAASIL